MNAFTWPQPGERRNPSAIPVPDDDVTQLLLAMVTLEVIQSGTGYVVERSQREIAGRLFNALDDVAKAEIENYAHDNGIPIDTLWWSAE